MQAAVAVTCPMRVIRVSKLEMLHTQVVAVTAVRTGAGKSQVSQYVNTVLHDHRLKTVLVRHPMPYG